jgi:hypothetical protein
MKPMPIKSRELIWPLLAAAALAAVGCKEIVSVYPFYTERDLVTEPALAGTWCEPGETNESDHVEFRATGPGRYAVEIRTRAETNSPATETSVFEFCAFRLKTGLYLDADMRPPRNEGVAIPQHQVWRLTVTGAEMELMGLDYDWLRAHLKRHPNALRHLVLKPADTNSDIVLTASTRELQAFVMKHSRSPGLFSTNNTARLTRVGGGGPGGAVK